MNFGCSVGDFIAVLQLANNIRKQFVDAPVQFKAISDDVKVLSNVLRDVDDVLPRRDLTEQQKKNLDEIAQGCYDVLKSLEKTLDKYQELDSSAKCINAKSRRVWKRFQWDQKDIDQFRYRITLNISAFDTFLGRITSNVSFATKAGVDRLHERQDNRERRHEHQAILDWLTPIDYAAQQSNFIGRRQEGTGQWLLKSDEFQTWLKTSTQTLFCPGIPGAGKTIITSIVVDDLFIRFRNDATVGIAYLYCNYQRQQEQKPIDLLTSLLKQLVQEQPLVPEIVKSLYECHKSRRTRPSFDEVSKVLHSVVAGFSRAFIIIDALDECQTFDGGRTRLLSEIISLQAKTGANLFATSRFIPEIERECEGRILEIRASDEDVRRYLDGHMSRLPKCVSRSLDLREKIKAEIIKATDGMFLLAQLHLDSLIDKTTPAKITRALKDLPKGLKSLDRVYEKAMERIEGQELGFRQLAERVLSWITFAKRPLTTLELRHALAVEVGESALDEDNLEDTEEMISVCAGLATVEEGDIIRLIHYTTQQFLESWLNTRNCISRANPQSNITMSCVTYLTFDTFETGFCPTDEKFEERLQLNPLYDYAARNWGHHAREASVEVDKLILDLLMSEAKVSGCSQAMMASWLYSNYNYSQRVPKQMTGLHVASYFGLGGAMIPLLEHGHDANSRDSYGRTPLSWAASNGHEVVVKLLLEKGAQLECNDKYGQTPLSWAAGNGHEAVVKLLLEKGAQLESKDTEYGQTPLSWAAENGNDAVVKLLVEKGAQLECNDKYGRTPLSWAAGNGREAVVKLLLEKGAQLESKETKYGRTPVSLAASNGHEAVVKLLVEKGAQLESRDTVYGRTPLSWAASDGHEGMVKLLLEKAVDVNPKDNYYRTPLSWAAGNGHEAVVKLLLANDGVDSDSKDFFGRTPLSCAAMKGYEAIVKLLLTDDGIDPDSKDSFGWTPLSKAARKGHPNVVKLLLEKHGENGIVIREGGLAIATPPVASHQSRLACDICDYSIPDADTHHHCGTCIDGDFDICRECSASGAFCMDRSHKMVKRMVKDGSFVEVPD